MNARSPRHWFVFALCLFPLVSFAPRVAGARDQATPGFAARPGFTLDVPQFSDDEVSSLTKTLDGLLLQTPGAREAHGRPVSFLTSAARSVFGEYFRQLQGGRLTPAQESRVLAYLDDLASAILSGGEDPNAHVALCELGQLLGIDLERPITVGA